jgi:hypothetical protein
MRKIFDVSINEVVELIEGQVSQVRNDQRKQVKVRLLSVTRIY